MADHSEGSTAERRSVEVGDVLDELLLAYGPESVPLPAAPPAPGLTRPRASLRRRAVERSRERRLAASPADGAFIGPTLALVTDHLDDRASVADVVVAGTSADDSELTVADVGTDDVASGEAVTDPAPLTTPIESPIDPEPRGVVGTPDTREQHAPRPARTSDPDTPDIADTALDPDLNPFRDLVVDEGADEMPEFDSEAIESARSAELSDAEEASPLPVENWDAFEAMSGTTPVGLDPETEALLEGRSFLRDGPSRFRRRRRARD